MKYSSKGNSHFVSTTARKSCKFSKADRFRQPKMTFIFDNSDPLILITMLRPNRRLALVTLELEIGLASKLLLKFPVLIDITSLIFIEIKKEPSYALIGNSLYSDH